MPEKEELKAVRVMVTGVVQGVGYRYFARRAARELGLSGYVRNVPDGSVEAVVEGSAGMVDEFLRALRNGPSASSVRGLTVSEIPPARREGFEIRI